MVQRAAPRGPVLRPGYPHFLGLVGGVRTQPRRFALGIRTSGHLDPDQTKKMRRVLKGALHHAPPLALPFRDIGAFAIEVILTFCLGALLPCCLTA